MVPTVAVTLKTHKRMLFPLGNFAAIIDVRQPAEYRLDGYVEGTENIAAYTWEHGFHLPAATFAADVARVHDPSEIVLLLCANGQLAAGAAAVLEAAEFSNVGVVEGGLRAWEAEAEDENEEVPPLVIDDDGEGGLTGAWV